MRRIILKDNPYYCSLLWRHICVRPNYEVQPCCRFELSQDHESISADDCLADVINDPYFRKARQNIINKVPVSGCTKCYTQENNGISSLRQKSNSDFRAPEVLSDSISVQDIEYLEFFISNTCNLKCLTCYPQISSSWIRDYKDLGWPVTSRTRKQNVKKLIDQLPNLRRVKFVGGEPLLEKQHLQILQTLQNPAEIHLEYYTNCTVWPSEDVLHLWDQFKKVEIRFSLDGFAEVNDYVRFPSKWIEVENIFKKFLNYSEFRKNFVLAVNCTVSIYNVWTLHKLKRWIENIVSEFSMNPIRTLFFNPVRNPKYLRIDNLPEEFKEKAIATLEENMPDEVGLINLMKHPSEEEPNLYFITYTQSLDRIRKTHIKNYIPEMTELIYPPPSSKNNTSNINSLCRSSR